jgi:hypothetical protein
VTFQRGDTHLVAADPGCSGSITEPCFKVLVAKNAAGEVQGGFFSPARPKRSNERRLTR